MTSKNAIAPADPADDSPASWRIPAGAHEPELQAAAARQSTSTGGRSNDSQIFHLRPALPSLSTWQRSPGRALRELLVYPLQLALYPMYKQRLEHLQQHLGERSDISLDIATNIMEGITKEQETVALMSALLLSIAASSLFSVPDAVSSLQGQHRTLRDLYLLSCSLGFGSEALAVCLSVLIILTLNSMTSDDKFQDVVDFVKDFWPFLGGTSILTAMGLLGISSAVVLYSVAGVIVGTFSPVVPVLIGLSTVTAYVLGASMLVKILLHSFKGSSASASQRAA